MTRIKAPNGDIYDLDAAVASGLLGSPGSGWERIEDPEKDIPRAQGAKIPGPGRGAHPAEVHRPAEDAPIEEWQAYADHINLDRGTLDRDGIIQAVKDRDSGKTVGDTATGSENLTGTGDTATPGGDGAATEPSGTAKAGGDDGTAASTEGAPKGNASAEAWAEYAGTLGVDVTGLDKRGDIRAAIEKHQAAQK